jgi:purine-binding chemotaxis protein CheW
MRKFIVFRLGGDEFGVDVEKVIEILKSHRAKPVPDLPDYLSGVVTVRGEVVPLLDMRKRLGIDPAPGKERAVHVRTGLEKVGLLVDDVKELMDFDDNEISTPPLIFRGLKNKYIMGLGKKQDRVIVLLNIDNILTAREKIKLRKAREAMKGSG